MRHMGLSVTMGTQAGGGGGIYTSLTESTSFPGKRMQIRAAVKIIMNAALEGRRSDNGAHRYITSVDQLQFSHARAGPVICILTTRALSMHALK